MVHHFAFILRGDARDYNRSLWKSGLVLMGTLPARASGALRSFFALIDRLAASIELIIAAQNPEGGWRYTPQPRDADVSVTVCQVMALRAAHKAAAEGRQVMMMSQASVIARGESALRAPLATNSATAASLTSRTVRSTP